MKASFICKQILSAIFLTPILLVTLPSLSKASSFNDGSPALWTVETLDLGDYQAKIYHIQRPDGSIGYRFVGWDAEFPVRLANDTYQVVINNKADPGYYFGLSDISSVCQQYVDNIWADEGRHTPQELQKMYGLPAKLVIPTLAFDSSRVGRTSEGNSLRLMDLENPPQTLSPKLRILIDGHEDQALEAHFNDLIARQTVKDSEYAIDLSSNTALACGLVQKRAQVEAYYGFRWAANPTAASVGNLDIESYARLFSSFWSQPLAAPQNSEILNAIVFGVTLASGHLGFNLQDLLAAGINGEGLISIFKSMFVNPQRLAPAELRNKDSSSVTIVNAYRKIQSFSAPSDSVEQQNRGFNELTSGGVFALDATYLPSNPRTVK